MMHSPKFDKVRRYFEDGLWTAVMVRNAVVKGWIAEVEYAEITGEAYADQGDALAPSVTS